MNTRVSELLAEIRKLEDQLEDAIRSHEKEFLYKVDGAKVRFEKAVRQAHRKFRTGILPWLGSSELRNIATAPVIYAMLAPLAILDLAVTVYQFLCFPLYQIEKVRRRDFILIDRHQLSYLNGIEKMNCVYCGYASGLIAFVREVIARTEQYWCPIKHARKILDPHRRYARYAEFGEAETYPEHQRTMRDELAKLKDE